MRVTIGLPAFYGVRVLFNEIFRIEQKLTGYKQLFEEWREVSLMIDRIYRYRNEGFPFYWSDGKKIAIPVEISEQLNSVLLSWLLPYKQQLEDRIKALSVWSLSESIV